MIHVATKKNLLPNDLCGDHQSSAFHAATASDQRPSIIDVRWAKKKIVRFLSSVMEPNEPKNYVHWNFLSTIKTWGKYKISTKTLRKIREQFWAKCATFGSIKNSYCHATAKCAVAKVFFLAQKSPERSIYFARQKLLNELDWSSRGKKQGRCHRKCAVAVPFFLPQKSSANVRSQQPFFCAKFRRLQHISNQRRGSTKQRFVHVDIFKRNKYS